MRKMGDIIRYGVGEMDLVQGVRETSDEEQSVLLCLREHLVGLAVCPYTVGREPNDFVLLSSNFHSDKLDQSGCLPT